MEAALTDVDHRLAFAQEPATVDLGKEQLMIAHRVTPRNTALQVS